MGFWSFLKSIPGKIASGVKSVAGKVWDGAKSIAGKVSSGFDKVRDIAGQVADMPVIGDIAKMATMNPLVGKVVDTFNKADSYVKMGNSILNPQAPDTFGVE
jgi:phage-related protein